MLGDLVFELFVIYLEKVRPAIAPKDEDPATARLFLRVKKDGKIEPDTNLGRHVKRFARDKLNLAMTTASIRALVDTNVVAEHRRGNLTDEQVAATYRVSGHSADTSLKYYQRYIITYNSLVVL